ncbi:MAG: YEATS-associated helix-containing protein [Bacteroidales bacterium]
MEQAGTGCNCIGMLPLLAFLGATLIAGTAGGFANFLLARNSKLMADGGTDGLPWWGYCFVGVVAAFTVPLFLNLTQSNLLKDWLDRPTTSGGLVNLAVYGGFCLVAAFSSRAFMQGMADRVLAQLRSEVEGATKQIAEDAKKQIAEVKEETQRKVEDATSNAVEVVSEMLSAPRGAGDTSADESAEPVGELGRQIMAVLAAGEDHIGNVGKKLSRSNLSTFIQLNNVLIPRGLVQRRRDGEDGPYLYSLTDAGRSHLRQDDTA